MADNNLPRDELEALRWFRERLRHLGRERPRLKTRRLKEHLTAHLTQQPPEEQHACLESPQATPEADQQAADTSTHPGA